MNNNKSDLSVLFVDDEEKSLKYFEKIFSDDFHIITANDIDSAWDIVNDKSKKIAVVISDQKMPNGTGVELLNRIRNKYPGIIRILTTGYASLSDNIAAINQSHIFAYLAKPWDIEEVRNSINNALIEYETQNTLLSLGSSIAHEVRNPLAAISMALNQIKSFVHVKMEESGVVLNSEIVGMIHKMIDTSFNSIKRANNIIDITLDNIKGKEPDPANFTFLKASEIITNAANEYGYQDEKQKEKIILNIEDDFTFKGDETLVIYVLFNLIKNALYYLNEYPNSVITITSETGSDYNKIYVKDTGPGIPAGKIDYIFVSFVTSGKKGGTGLGLSFCKKTMSFFGGNITCKSVEKEFTEFTLTFPVLENEQPKVIDSSKINNKNVKILIVDDKENNLINLKNIIESRLQNVVINIAKNGKEAVRKSANNNYNLIFMDVNMPIMDGILATKKIREFDKEVIIIAYTSMASARAESIEAGCNDYIFKPADPELLIKTICKWNLIKYDFAVPKTDEEIKSILKDKRILIADDEKVNRFMISSYLTKVIGGVKTDEVMNGRDLVNKLTSPNNYDLIISDINMPGIDGMEATREIRKYQHDNNYKPIPIIAYSGESQKDSIIGVLNSGMDDYFIKGDKNDHLLEIILFWLDR